jgi:hypothetical protein
VFEDKRRPARAAEAIIQPRQLVQLITQPHRPGGASAFIVS